VPFYEEWLVRGTDAWDLMYMADTDDYQTFLPDAKTTISSFRLE
jgi:hypothetical protein